MKNFIYLLLTILVISCVKDDDYYFDQPVDSKLEILDVEGLKFQGSDITDG